jgi:hypothetical protein
MDEDIRHICDELLLPRLFRKETEEFGICTAESLMAAKEGIKTEKFFRDMKSVLAEKDLNLAREKLLVVIEWREKNPDANIIEMFSEKVYNDIRLSADFVDDYIKTALGKSNLKGDECLYRDMEEEDLMSMIDKCKDIIMESNHLRSAVGNFDYHSFLDKTIRHFHSLVGNESGALEMEKLFIVAGRTQAGKSAVKGVIQSLCGLLRIPLIILTNGVGESIDLHAKLVDLSAGTLVKKEHIIVGKSF